MLESLTRRKLNVMRICHCFIKDVRITFALRHMKRLLSEDKRRRLIA